MDKEILEKELAPFLGVEAAPALKCIAMENVLGLTGSEEGHSFLSESDILLTSLVNLTTDSISEVQEMAIKGIINIALKESTCWKILNVKDHKSKVPDWFRLILDCNCKHADLLCKMLSNLTRSEKCVQHVSKLILKDDISIFENVVQALCNVNYNKNANLHYLAAVLENLSQARDVRNLLMDKEKCIFQRLLPFTMFQESSVRRRGVIGVLKNCCFDTEYHEWLLGDKVDMLPRLLLPLAGPEEFDDEDMDRLPDELQYLPADKERESDPEIRKMLLEALLQLCATRNGRSFLKEKNTYVIMREYFAWERKHEPTNEIAAMNLIDILIGDEPTEEFGDNLKTVDIPEDMQKKFHEDDEKELKLAEEEKLERLQKSDTK